MEGKLKVRFSSFKTHMSFNEWAEYTKASILWDENTNEMNRKFI